MSRTAREAESPASALPISSRLSRANPRKFFSSANLSVSKVCKRQARVAPRSHIFSEPISRKVGSWHNCSVSFISS